MTACASLFACASFLEVVKLPVLVAMAVGNVMGPKEAFSSIMELLLGNGKELPLSVGAAKGLPAGSMLLLVLRETCFSICMSVLGVSNKTLLATKL